MSDGSPTALSQPSATNPKSSIPLLKSAMSARTRSGSANPPAPLRPQLARPASASPGPAPDSATGGRPAARLLRSPSLQLSATGSFGSGGHGRSVSSASLSPSPSPYAQSVKQPVRKKPSLVIERPAVRFNDMPASASPMSAITPSSIASASPLSPGSPADNSPRLSLSGELMADTFSLSPPAKRHSSRAHSLCLSPQELTVLHEPAAPKRDRQRAESVTISASISPSSTGSCTPVYSASTSKSSSLSSTTSSLPPPPAASPGSSSENIQVIVRCRPHAPSELRANAANYMSFGAQQSLSLRYKGKEKSFTFDHIFASSASQAMLYQQHVANMVEQCMAGYNGCIFAYGQTGSGKSHTMMGDLSVEEEAGIVPRAIDHIFAHIQEQTVDPYTAADPDGSDASRLSIKFGVSLSFLEIYNEKASDLLVDDKRDLEVRESDGYFFLPYLTRPVVRSRDELLALIRVGNDHRNVAATAQNSRSSRSHTILTLHIEKRVVSAADKNELLISSKLNLVDLAGSERLSTSTKHKQGRETLSINLSLSCLSNCILCLTEGSIPTYRDSKLTRLLKDSLGGNSKTTMIACVSGLDSNASETVSTLRWAERAKRVKNQPVVNDGDAKDGRLRELKEEMEALKSKLTGRNKDMIRIMWMVRQLSNQHSSTAGSEHKERDDSTDGSGRQRVGQHQVDLALTEAILQDPFNHPMAALIANEHDDDDHSAAFDLTPSPRPFQEEKEADDDALDGGEAKAASPFIAAMGSASPVDEQRAVRRPSSAPQRMREVADRNGTMKLFSMFKALTQQIKQEVKEIPAFDESDRTSFQRRPQHQQPHNPHHQPHSKDATTTSAAATTATTATPTPDAAHWQSLYEAMRAQAESAEEGRMYLDGVVADLQRQLMNDSDRHMQQLMSCRCKEWEGKCDTLSMQLDEEQQKRQAAEAEAHKVQEEMAALKQYQTAQNNARNGEVKEMRRKATDKEQECKELSTQLEEAHARIERMRDMQLEATQAKVDKVAMEAELDTMKAAESNSTAEVAALQVHVKQLLTDQAEAAEMRGRMEVDVRRVRSVLLDARRTALSRAPSTPSSKRATMVPSSSSSATRRDSLNTMRELSVTMTHAQVRAMMASGAPPATAAPADAQAPVDRKEQLDKEAADEQRLTIDQLLTGLQMRQQRVDEERRQLLLRCREAEQQKEQCEEEKAALEKELKETENELDELERSVGQHKQQAQQLQTTCEQHQATIDDLQLQIVHVHAQRKESLASGEKEAKDSRARVQALESELTDCTRKLTDANEQLQMHRQSVGVMAAQHEELIASKQELILQQQDSIDRVTLQLDEQQQLMHEATEELKREQARIEQLEGEKETWQSEQRQQVQLLDAVTSELEVKQAMVAQLTDRTDSEKRRLESELQELAQTVQQRADDEKQVREQLIALQARMVLLQLDHEQSTQQAQSLQTELVAHQDAAAQLKEDNERNRAELDAATQQLAAIQTQLVGQEVAAGKLAADLREQHTSAQTTESRRAELEVQLAASVAQLSTQADQHMQALSEAQRHWAEQKAHSKQRLQAVQAELTAATQRLEDKEQALQALTAAHAEHSHAQQQLAEQLTAQHAAESERAAADATAERDSHQRRIEQLEQQKVALAAELQQLTTRLQAVTAELGTAQAVTAQVRGQSGEMDAQVQQLTQLQSSIGDKEAAIASLTEKLTAADSNISALQARLEQQRAESCKATAEVQAEVERHRKQTEQITLGLTETCSELRQQLVSLQSHSDKEQQDLRAAYTASEQRASQLHDQQKTSSECAQQAESQLVDATRRHEELAQRNELLRAECDTVRESLATLTAEFDGREWDATALQAQLEAASAQTAGMRATLAAQSQQLQEAQAAQAALTTTQQQLGQMQAEVSSKEAIVDQLTAELSEKQAKVHQLSATIATLQASQHTTGSEQHQMAAAMVEKEERLAELQQTLAAVQLERQTMQVEVQQLTAVQQQANELINQLQIDATALRSSLSTLSNEHAAQQLTLAASQQQVSALIEQSSVAASDKTQLAQQLSTATAQLGALTARQAELETTAAAHSAHATQLAEQKAHSKQRLQAVQAELTAATQRLEDKEQALQALTAAHAEHSHAQQQLAEQLTAQHAAESERAAADATAERDSHQRRIEQLEQQKVALAAELQQLTTRLQAVTAELGTAQAVTAQVRGQSGEMDAQVQQLTQLQSSIGDKEAAIASLTEKLTAADSNISALQARLEQQRAESCKATAEVQAEVERQRKQEQAVVAETKLSLATAEQERQAMVVEVAAAKQQLSQLQAESEQRLTEQRADRALERADAAWEVSQLQDRIEREQQAGQQHLSGEQEDWRCRIDVLAGRLRQRETELEQLTVEQQTAEDARQAQVQCYQQRLSAQSGRVEELEANLLTLQAELAALDSKVRQRSISPVWVNADDGKQEAGQRSAAHSRTPSARQAMVEHALELVRDELKQERRKMAALQDRLAHCVCEAAASSRSSSSGSIGSGSSSDQPTRRRLAERTMSLPSSLAVLPFASTGTVSFRRASLLPMTAANSLLFSTIHRSVMRSSVATSVATASWSLSSPRPSLPPSSLPSSHPLHEVTSELRSCYRLLQTEYSDCVESKLQLARVAAGEVDSMRDELNAVRREEWERVLAVDKVQRMRKRGEEGWHEAREYETAERPEGKCSIM